MAMNKLEREFVDFGKEVIMELLHASEEGHIDKNQAYETVMDRWRNEHGEWAPQLSRLEKKSRGGEQPVYRNRLWWMTAELAGGHGMPKTTEKATGLPFIALVGCLDAALEAYGLESKKDMPTTTTPSRDAKQVESDSDFEHASIFDGCFLEPDKINDLVGRLRNKKNLILQGPPGTGKTWLAKRLGYALMESRDDTRLRAVQFHPNLSYEDFVRGWRPTATGLVLTDGIFVKAIKAAIKQPQAKFIVVIEEINRGNPAHIFGELLTLLEDSKRTPDEALELCYPDPDAEEASREDPARLHVPPNLYVIGTMNLADRSLAIVDTALRRRFAFVELAPQLNDRWQAWVTEHCNVPADLAGDIRSRLTKLNLRIEDDPQLGRHFCIGHSYVTPPGPILGAAPPWFRDVVETEIGPQLEELWFDRPELANEAKDELLVGWPSR